MSGSREASVQWTSEQADMLLDLIKGGITSFARAAELLNVKFGTSFSRCAISGKAKRMGLCQPRKIRMPKPARISKATAGPKLPAKTTRLRCDPIEPGTVNLLDLKEGMCRYPTGEGAENIRFCGRWKVEGKPYCSEHCAIAFRIYYRRAA